MFTPMVYLSLALATALPITYGVTKIKAMQDVKTAYTQGYEAGFASSAVGGVKEATKTVEILREAVENTPIPKDKVELIKLCKKSASCRDRGKL